MRDHKVVMSGAGGQGIMFIGKLLANLALSEYPSITFLPSYGAEVRGGTSNCHIVLSHESIASPVVESADAQVLMNQPSVDRFLGSLAATGKAFVNTSMASAEGDNAVGIPASQIALELGDVLAANVVMLAAYLSQMPIVDRNSALEGVLSASKPKGDMAVEINRRAFEAGWRLLT